MIAASAIINVCAPGFVVSPMMMRAPHAPKAKMYSKSLRIFDIVPKFWKQRGKVMVPYTYAETVEGLLLPVAKKDPKMRLALFKHELTPVVTEQEITIDYKDADTHTHPHPFGSDTIARVVLMHPESLVANDVADWLKEGSASEIVQMIQDGDLIPGTDLIAHPYSPIPTVKFKLR